MKTVRSALVLLVTLGSLTACGGEPAAPPPPPPPAPPAAAPAAPAAAPAAPAADPGAPAPGAPTGPPAGGSDIWTAEGNPFCDQLCDDNAACGGTLLCIEVTGGSHRCLPADCQTCPVDSCVIEPGCTAAECEEAE